MLIEKEVGAGNESVYVYYFESQKGEADSWPCKVGRSRGCPENRIKQQQASMMEEPVIGLIIWTENSRLDEAIIHNELSENKVESFGKEWFYTKPGDIESLYIKGLTSGSIGSLVRVARYERNLTQTELALKAGVRQETVSVIETGSNTTTRAIEKIMVALGKKITLVDAD